MPPPPPPHTHTHTHTKRKKEKTKKSSTQRPPAPPPPPPYKKNQKTYTNAPPTHTHSQTNHIHKCPPTPPFLHSHTHRHIPWWRGPLCPEHCGTCGRGSCDGRTERCCPGVPLDWPPPRSTRSEHAAARNLLSAHSHTPTPSTNCWTQHTLLIVTVNTLLQEASYLHTDTPQNLQPTAEHSTDSDSEHVAARSLLSVHINPPHPPSPLPPPPPPPHTHTLLTHYKDNSLPAKQRTAEHIATGSLLSTSMYVHVNKHIHYTHVCTHADTNTTLT